MDFKSKLKMPKVDIAGAAAALQNVTKLIEYLQTIGTELGDIVKALGDIGGLISSGEMGPAQTSTLRASVEEINSSRSKVEDSLQKIKEILAELKKFAGEEDDNKPAEKKGKIPRVIDAACSLVEIVTQILDLVVQVAEKAEGLGKAEGEGMVQLGSEIKDGVKDIAERVLEAKEQVKIIIEIAKGGEGGGGKGKSDIDGVDNGKDKGAKSDKSKAQSAKANGTEDKKSDDDEGGCWARIKSCCCCCCN